MSANIISKKYVTKPISKNDRTKTPPRKLKTNKKNTCDLCIRINKQLTTYHKKLGTDETLNFQNVPAYISTLLRSMLSNKISLICLNNIPISLIFQAHSNKKPFHKETPSYGERLSFFYKYRKYELGQY